MGEYPRNKLHFVEEEIKMLLAEPVMKSLRVAKVHREHAKKITTIDYSPDGNYLISCGEDDQIVVYDCQKATQARTIFSHKYGVDTVHFVQGALTAIHSSTKVDDIIRHLDLKHNSYIRYFPGHTKKVVSLSVSPDRQSFLSSSLDKTLRLWDVRSYCRGVMGVNGPPIAAFDPTGSVFAAAINSECIKLYDQKMFEKGPFASFKQFEERGYEWTGLKFSPDGKTIMICTNNSKIRLFDAFNGKLLHTFTVPGYLNAKKTSIEASFSPDSQFVFSGSIDGRVHVWNVDVGSKLCELNGGHPGAVHCVQFNPKFMMLASACNHMMFWLPNLAEIEK